MNRIRMGAITLYIRRWNGGGPVFKAAKWVPVFAICGIVSWSYYAFVIQLCLISIQEPWRKAAFLVGYHVFLGLFLWSYVTAILTTACHIPEKFKIPSDVLERMKNSFSEVEKNDMLEEIVRNRKLPMQTSSFWNHGHIRTCHMCHIIKPDRVHHCKICGTCILKMDHHCPFINNCIGFNNQKYFLVFLLHAQLYTSFIALSTFPFMTDYWHDTWNAPKEGRYHIFMVFVISCLFSLSLFGKFTLNFVLVAKNMTLVDIVQPPVFKDGPDKYGFSIGFFSNLSQVFGRHRVKWFFPVFTSLGDGISFPSKYGSAAENGIISCDSKYLAKLV